MSPLNRGPLLGPRMQPPGMRPPLARFHPGRLPLMPGMPQRMPPPMGPMFGPGRRMMPPRPGIMMRPGGPPPPLFGRSRGVPPLMPPMMCPRGMVPRGLPMRPPLRGLLQPQGLPHARPKFPMGNGNLKGKPIVNVKKINKLEELELKKPWMTDEIRGEIQKKNKLYVKAKKNKEAPEWDEFKDLRNKVTRMIRDAKNEYLGKHPEQAHIYQGNDEDEPYDQRDENYVSSEDETTYYCEVCDREFFTAILLERHRDTHKTCGIDGCVFTAHPKLVEKHISMQHCTGLYRRMKNITTPEDIQNWITERKKKYPTKCNIDRKQAEATEKKERGEIIAARQSSTASKPSDKQIRPRRRKLRKRKIEDSKPEPLVVFYRGLRPFAGTANLPHDNKEENEEKNVELDRDEESEIATLPMDVSCNISDEEDETTQLPEIPAATADANGNKLGLACLVANYGSDSTDDEGPIEVPIKKIQLDLPADNQSNQVPNLIIEKSSEHADVNSPKILNAESITEKNSASTEDTPKEASTENRSNRRIRPATTKNVEKIRQRKHLMLLQRLLSRSMQHERNLICQCIKYIADNNFLQ